MDPTSLMVEPRTSSRVEARVARGSARNAGRRILLTVSAGFSGVNGALPCIPAGWHATLCDNLSRPGKERNLKWLITQPSTQTAFVKEDVRNAANLAEH